MNETGIYQAHVQNGLLLDSRAVKSRAGTSTIVISPDPLSPTPSTT
jgi:hypothetical protein